MPLFSEAEARAFDKGQLADSSAYSSAAITAKSAEIKEWLERACGVNFESTTHTDEYHDGDGTSELLLDWPRVTAVTAASQRDDATWTALTAAELAELQPYDTGLVYWDGATWNRGRRNIKVTYTAGYTAVPSLIKRAALMICVTEMPATNAAFAAESYEAGGMSVSFGRGDGFGGNWHAIPDVMKAIRLYDHHLPGIA